MILNETNILMACVGIDFCSQKTCLEQEKCVHDIKRSLVFDPKPQIKIKSEIQTKLCPGHLKFCSNKRACEILGECLLQHPLVKADQTATNQLRKSCSIPKIIGVISRLKPGLKKIGKIRKNNR